jgi:hypothetical protein
VILIAIGVVCFLAGCFSWVLAIGVKRADAEAKAAAIKTNRHFAD